MKNLKLVLIGILAMSVFSSPVLASDDHGGNGGGESGEDDIVARGAIVSISPTSLTVGSMTFAITASTTYEGVSDQPATIADFTVGDIVEVKASQNPDSSLVALKLELEDDSDSEDDDHHGGGSGSHGSNASTLRSKCSFPDLNIIRNGIEQAVSQSLTTAGATVTKVKARVGISGRPAVTAITSNQAISGIVVTADASGAVGVTGAIAPEECSAMLNVQIKIGQGSAAVVQQTQLPISGILGVKSKGHR